MSEVIFYGVVFVGFLLLPFVMPSLFGYRRGINSGIEPGAVSMNAHGKTVSCIRRIKNRGQNDKPPLSRTVTSAHLKSRRKVNKGKITNWDQHGNVAIVTDANGVSAAFYCYELGVI